MSEEALPRPRRGRRAVVAIGRAVALLILITGIDGVLIIAAPRLLTVPRYVISLVAGVAIFETLRPGRRGTPAPPAVEALPLPADLVDAHRTIEELRAEAERVRRETDEASAALQQQLAQSEAQIAGLGEQVAKARSEANAQSELRARDAEQARARDAQIRQRYEAENENLQSAASKALEDIQSTRSMNEDLRAQVERERAHAADLESQLAGFDARLVSALQELDALRADRQRLRRELEEALQRGEMGKVSLQKELAEAVAARDAAAAEGRQRHEALTAQLEEERLRFYQELEHQTSALREEAEATLAGWVDQLHQALDREHDLAEKLTESRKLLEEETTRLKAEQERLGEQTEAEWSEKLQKIVTGLTTDHENDIGDAIAAREAARAEVRSLNLRLQELEKQLENARDGRMGLLQRDDESAKQLEIERKARAMLEEETVALKARLESIREQIDAEWSDKLQTIVSHLAADHEADIGKAIEERETARAEARSLSMKVSSLQKKIDQERKSFAAAQEELMTMRQVELPLPPPEPIVSEPQVSEEDERRTRAQVLEFAEQAHEALRKATSPGDVPIPAPERQPRILFVHHDPALRTMWRDNLAGSGFEVQTAADGLEGLRMAIAEKPDVVIADTSMPKMDGRELCQLIKSNQDTHGVKVILMTGIYTSEERMPSSEQEFEADELLRKPVKPETMKAAVSNLLAARVGE